MTTTRRSVTLHANDSINLTTGQVTRSNRSQSQSAKTVYPWYPLEGHREGLRANDLVTLASALKVISFHGGTAYRHSVPCECGIGGCIRAKSEHDHASWFQTNGYGERELITDQG